ncbi:MAG: Hsp20/alpha crystallin family protein [Candidatus Hodarchaeales archaeon]
MDDDPSDIEEFLRKLLDQFNLGGIITPENYVSGRNIIDLNSTMKESKEEMIIEPEYERIVDGDLVIMIFTLPGVKKEDIHFKRKGRYLIVEARAKNRNRFFRKQVVFESFLDESTIKGRVKNGFLELTVKKFSK